MIIDKRYFSLNLFVLCKSYRVGLWQCPPFLFLIFGFLTVSAMVATYGIANRYFEDPRLVALLIIGVTTILLIIGFAIVSGFERLAEASRLKSEFVSIVSHQLRTPLSSMRWLIEFMSGSKSSALSSENRSNMEMLHEINIRMLRLVNLLLEVNQVEDSRIVLEKNSVDVKYLTEEIVRGFSVLARSRNVKINISAETDLPKISVDQRRLNMVIENLVDNAIQYSLGEGEISINIERQGNYLKWLIYDHGVGIPKMEQKKIFEKFFRARNAARFQTRGSGLGLFITRAFIEAMGGSMGFSSEEKKGSKFWFFLPIINEK